MRRSGRRFEAFVFGILACVALASSSQAQVVINEINYNPLGTDSEVLLEFVEFQCTAGAPVDIGGWELDFGPEPFVFPPGTILAPGEYIVVAENIANLSAATGYTAGFEFGSLDTNLGNGGDEIILRDGPAGLSNEIDLVVCDDDPPWPPEPDGGGPSLELIHPALDNNLSSSWLPSLVTHGTPGAQNSVYSSGPTVAGESPTRLSSVATLPSVTVNFSMSVTGVSAGDLTVNGSPATAVSGSGAGPYLFSGYAAPLPGSTTIALASGAIENGGLPFDGDSWTVSVGLVVVINELHYHPPDLVADAEFIELYNAGSNAADMADWQISDGLDMIFPAGTTLAPGEYLVVALDAALFQALTGYSDALQWVGGRLSNGGERIALSDADGNELDVVDYADGGSWPGTPDGDGPSLELINPLLPNQYGPAWVASLAEYGTPGAENSGYQSSPAPIIVDVIHDPPIPGAGQPVTVTAEVIDIGTPLVLLFYRQDQEPTIAYSNTMMSNVGGSTYRATVAGLAEGQRLDFAVVANNGTSSIAPAGHDGNFAAGHHPPRTLLCKFSDTPVLTDLPQYHLITTQYTRDLQAVRDKTEYDATFLHCDAGGNCKIYYNVIERYRGASSLNQDPPSFRVEFPSDDPLESEMGFELTSLNLMGQQPARQALGYGLFEDLGDPVPKNQFARLNTNPLAHRGTQDWPYINVERIDDDFFASQNGDLSPLRFPDRCDVSETVCDSDVDCPTGETCLPTDTGSCYRGRHDYNARLVYLGDDPDAYRVDLTERNGYQQITNEDEDDWTDLINLVDALWCSTSDGGSLCVENTYDGWYPQHLPDYGVVSQWARWFGMHMVLNNTEGGIYRDTGDDYFIYFWPTKDHATFLPWDMDAIIPATNETIWRTTVTSVQRFLRHNEFAGLFVGAVCDQLDTVFSVDEMNARIDALPDALFPTGTPQGNGPQTKQGMKDWVVARHAYIENEIRRQTTLSGVPASPYMDPNPVISLSGELNQCGAYRVVVNGIDADSYTIANPGGVGADWLSDFTLAPGNNAIVVQTLDHDGVEIDRAEATVFYAPPGTGAPDSLRMTMPTRMVNDKTLTLKAEILDELDRIHWETWTAVGTVSARRVSDQTPIPTTITVFETYPAGTGAGGPGPDQIRFYNGVGSVSFTIDDPVSVAGQQIEIEVSVLGLSATKLVTVLDNQPALFTTLSGALSGDGLDWGPQDGVIHLTGSVTVPSGSTLTIAPGTLVMVDAGPSGDGTAIQVTGSNVVAQGTAAEPIFFFPTNGPAAMVLPQTTLNNPPSWQGFRHQGSGNSSYDWVFITGAGNGPSSGHPRPPVFYLSDSHALTMQDCVVADSPGKINHVTGSNNVTIRRTLWSRVGYGGEFLGGGHTLLIEDSWFTRIGRADEAYDVDGDIFHLDNASSDQTVRRSVLADCGDDMIDHSGATPVVEDTLIWDADDKCVSLSGGGNVTFTNVLVFGMPIGINGAGAILDHVTIANVGMPMGAPISVQNTIVWPAGMNTGSCDGNINYTLAGNTGHLACGTGNLSTDPLFQDPANRDYSLQAGSPAASASSTGGRIGWLGFPEGYECVGDEDCDDGNACSLDTCDAGACVFNPIAGCTPCVGDPDCDDGNPCTVDTCNIGTCSNTTGNEGAVCDDGWDCTIDDECAAGVCGGTESCPPGQSCDGNGECVSAPATFTFQNDGIYDGTQDTFLQQAAPDAANGTLDNWEWDAEDPAPNQNIGLLRFDGIVGTGAIPEGTLVLSATLTLVIFDESVAPAGEIHAALDTWDQATTTWNNYGGEAGVQADEIGALVAVTPLAAGTHDIDVTSAVQAWVDDPASNFGLIFIPASNNGAQVRSSEYSVLAERPRLTVDFLPGGCTVDEDCDDGLYCNGVETCDTLAETCLSGAAVICDDGVGCTVDTCNETTDSCDIAPNDLACDDSNECTDDTCDLLAGCQYSNNTASCDDGDACTENDVCSGGTCQTGAAVDCDDGVACTDDTCDSGSGCLNTDTCTGGEVCNVGSGFCEVPQGPQPGDVIISGFSAHPEPEWIELFNTTSQPIALDTMTLVTRLDIGTGDGTVEVEWTLGASPAGRTIPAHGFFLVGESGLAPAPDLVDTMDLATGEGGTDERAISIELVIDGVHQDYVLYGRYDGSTPAGELPPGDVAFDGVSWPRTETVRTVTGTLPIASFAEGPAQRVSAEDLYAGYAVEGFYADEAALGDGYTPGVWTCAHVTTGPGTPRNSSSAPVLPPTQSCTSHAECDDGLYCNGVETCDIGGTDRCVDGTPVSCDDGLACTVDTCNETTDSCDHDLCSMTVVPAGSRYLAITPPAGLASVALRVDAPGLACLPRYVDLAGELGDTPVFQASVDWGTVYVGDREVVPDTTYDVQAEVVPGTAVGVGSATTWSWGQTNNVEDVNLFDVLCILDGFGGVFTHCSLHADDLMGYTPNRAIDVDDILAELDAFQSIPYPDTTPCDPALMTFEGNEARQAGVDQSGFRVAPVRSSGGSAGTAPALDSISLVASRTTCRPGEPVDIDVYLSGSLDLRAYQVALSVDGGSGGALRVEDLRIERGREDYAFAGGNTMQALDAPGRRLASVLVEGGVTAADRIYLGTFSMRSSQDARGRFEIGLRTAETMLRDSFNGAVDFDDSSTSVVIEIERSDDPEVGTRDVSAPGEVIISGFSAHPEPEWIELFNTTSQPIALDTMTLVTRLDIGTGDGTVEVEWTLGASPAGRTIPAHGFFLVGESGLAPAPDLVDTMDLATGEGGTDERAISIELVIDGVHQDYVLYGRYDGSTPAGVLPPGDVAFDGVSWPRTETVRTVTGTLPIASFAEGPAQRVSAEDLYAGYAVEGFYADEAALGDGYTPGVWTCAHVATGPGTPRNSSSAPVLPPTQSCTIHAECDDGVACTNDSCDLATGCLNLDSCTGGLTCNLGTGVCETQTLLPLPILQGDDWTYFKGQSEPPVDWNTVGFDDASWLVGPSGFGYGDLDDNTELLDMQNAYWSIYIRRAFYVTDPGAVTGLELAVDYDDGYVCYLNGMEIARSSNIAGTPPAYDTAPSPDHEAVAGGGGPVEVTSLSSILLLAGENVLACQGHNATLSSTDFTLIPELTGIIDVTAPNSPTLVAPVDGATGVTSPVELRVNVTDPDLDVMDVTFYGRPNGGAPPPEDFTLIHLGDTQFYSQSYPATFASITSWIVAEQASLNIQYLAQAGDIVNTATEIAQWVNADAALSLLDVPILPEFPDGIPYGTAPGNHDMDPNGNPAGTGNYNSYFGISRFQGRSYYGGNYNGTDNDNYYTLFSASGMDFITIHLEYNTSPDPAVLQWADSLLKAYPERRAIVTTHYIMELGEQGPFGNQGQLIFTALEDNPNLFLMLCGHRHGEGKRIDTTSVGTTVYTIVADYQDYPNGGNGWTRIMEFSPANDEIRVSTYSPVLNDYIHDADSEFVLPYEMEGGVPFVEIGTVTGVASGDDAFVEWSGLTPGTEYEWYVVVSDGTSNTTGPTWTLRASCSDSSQCEDYNPCTDDSCNSGTGECEFTPNTDSCDDGDLCTVGDVCSAGTCGAGTPITCGVDQTCNSQTGFCEADPVFATFEQGVGGYTGTIDTFLDSGAPTASNATAATLVVDLTPERHILLRFENLFLSEGGPIPDGATIDSASLSIAVTNESLTAGASLHRMLLPWDDSDSWDIWGSGIQVDGVEALATPDTSGTSDVGSYVLDVTDSLAAWSAGEPNYGWAWLPPATDNSWQFDSAEGSNPPVLSVTYSICLDDVECDDGNGCTLDSCSAGACVHLNDDGASCSDENLCTDSDVCTGGACVGTSVDCPIGQVCNPSGGVCETVPSVVIFQDGANGYAGTQDSYLQTAYPDNVNGGLETFEWDDDDPAGDPTEPNFGLVRFDDIIGTNPGQVPPGAIIVYASLTYTIFNTGLPAAIHEPLVDWDESTATMNNFCGATCDEGVEYSAASPDVAPASYPGQFSSDVTGSLQRWINDPGLNRGWILVPQPLQSAGGGVGIRSSEYATDPAERPILTVEYFEISCTLDEECDDYDVCNGVEICNTDIGQCVSGISLDCDDSNLCTDDSCDAAAGCSNVDNTAPCDDGDACTANDSCSGGACQSGGALDCDDAVDCTIDSCDPGLGCQNVDDCLVGEACNYATGICETDITADPLPIVLGDPWKYYKGFDEPSPADLTGWTQIGFDDSAWPEGGTGIGYDYYVETGGTNANGDYGPFVVTELDDMRGCGTAPCSDPGYVSVYLRRLFSVENPGLVASLTFETYSDDGFVAYLNGTEVARANMAGTPPTFDELATGGPAAGDTPPVNHTVDLTGSIGLLVAGTNVLTIQGHNTTLTSRDFLLTPQLSATFTAGCTGDGDCDDANPCTDDTCDVGSGNCQFTPDDGNLCSDGVDCTDDACSSGACVGLDNCTGGQVCNVTNGICETPAAIQPGDVIIAGFQAANNPQGSNVSEFVTLFNTTDTPISLEGMELLMWVDSNADGVLDLDWQLADELPDLTGATIAPYGFFLIAESGVAAPGGNYHDLETSLDLATGELGATERAGGLQLVIDGVITDNVIYGRHDGSDTGANPEGDIFFDGVSWPRAEVLRNTNPANASFLEGVCQRLSDVDLHSGYDVPGYYADESTLGAGYPDGVWSSPHSETYAAYESRNSLSPTVPPPSGEPCTFDSDCDDGDACNGLETCPAGTCVAGTPPGCDDGNPCTDDSCDPLVGCENFDNTLSCDDGNACTANDVCGGGFCSGNTITCDDGVACTDDTCDSLLGCQSTDNCSGGQSCNVSSGVCESGPTLIVFRQDLNGYVGTADTFIQTALPTAVNGALEALEWDLSDGTPAGPNFALIQFGDIFGPGPDQIPAGAEILSATLTYTVGGTADPTGEPATVHELLVPWDESVSYDTLGSDPGANADDEYDSLSVGTALGNVLGPQTVNVTTSLQAWIADPAANLGWIFVPAGPTGNGVEVRSSEYTTTPAERPTLTVEYVETVGAGLMSCQLTSDTAGPNGSVGLEIFLEDLGDLSAVRGYQTQIEITRTSGAGDVTVSCPGGVEVDDTRADYLFYSQPGQYPVTNCGLRRASSTLLSGGVVVGPSPAYLSGYFLDVSADATAGSTFAISFAAAPDSALADVNGDPLDLEFSADCVLTIQGCTYDSDCDDGNACTDDTCDAGSCVHTADDSNSCDDGDLCTESDVCQSGVCVGAAIDCSDGDVCTSDSCFDGACLYEPSGVCGVSGSVWYYRDTSVEPSSKPVSAVDIDASADALPDATTDTGGVYGLGDMYGSFLVTTLDKFGSPRAADHNNAVSSFDASFIAQHSVMQITLSANQQIAADVSGNGSVTSFDAARVAQFATELIDHFDVGTTSGSDWAFFRCDNYVDAGHHDCTSPVFAHDPLAQAEVDNFYALLYGDVTGNWVQAGGKAQSAEAQAALQDRKEADRLRSLGIKRAPKPMRAGAAVLAAAGWTGPAAAGEQRTITFSISNADGIEGLDFVLRYDPQAVAIVDVASDGIGSDFTTLSHDMNGEVRIAMYGVLPLEGSGSILNVTVMALKDTTGLSPVTLVGSANEGQIPLRGPQRDATSRGSLPGRGRVPGERN